MLSGMGRVVALSLVLGGCGGFGGPGVGASSGAANTASPGSTARALVSITIESQGLTISTPGMGQQLQATGVYSDGHVRDVTRAVTWSLGDPTIAAIDSTGFAWPLGPGKTSI